MVITDIDGNFALNEKPGATIVVPFTEKVSARNKDNDQTTVNITLKEDSEMLDEVVVVGYGTMKKSDLSGASVSMSEDKIKGSIITNLDQSLQGRCGCDGCQHLRCPPFLLSVYVVRPSSMPMPSRCM